MEERKDRQYLKITGEQLRKGWIEFRGVTPIHHNYHVVTVDDSDPHHDPVYIVIAPESTDAWRLNEV